MDIAVRPVLGAHVVQMVAGGELAPILEDVRIARLCPLFHRRFQRVELLGGTVLNRVPQPRRKIALAVGPRNPVGNVVLTDWLVALEQLAWSEEIVVPVVGVVDRGRQRVEELEDPRVGPLVLAKGLVVHEQVAAVAVAVDLVDPTREFLGGKRPFLPSSVGEAKGNVVGQAIVLQQQLDRSIGEIARSWRRVDIVGRTESEQAVDALADDRVVLSASSDVLGEGVRIDELGVAEDLGRYAEDLLHLELVAVDLLVKLRARKQERQ